MPAHVPGLRPRASLTALVGLALVLAVPACDFLKGKDQNKCDEGLRNARAALASGDSALTRQWRDYAYKYCSDTATLQRLDQEITSGEAARLAAAQAEELGRQKQKQFLQVFSTWAGQHQADGSRAAAAECEGDAAAKAQKKRWCQGDRQAGEHTFVVTYFEGEVDAVEFKTTSPEPVRCEDLGGVAARTWKVPGQGVDRHHCQINGGALAGLQAMVTEARNAPLYVFSAKYLERHAGMRAKVQQQGL